MRIIAIEEAFDTDDLKHLGVVKGLLTAVDEKVAADWDRRLRDFADWRIPDMDANGVDVQVLSLTVPGIQGISAADDAVAAARLVNDRLAATIREFPTRFRGFAALPMQDPRAAAAELRRCVLELGFCGALVNDHTNGRYYDDEAFAMVWEAFEDLDVPLYIHPGAPPSYRWNLFDGHSELRGALWSWGAEAGGHALRLIFGGVFDRHPRARVILGHMGEFLPFQRWRFDSRYRTLGRQDLSKMPSDYIGTNILITTSGVCSPETLTAAIGEVGEDAVLFSIDYPYESSKDAVDFLKAAPLDEKVREKVAFRNAERLLRI